MNKPGETREANGVEPQKKPARESLEQNSRQHAPQSEPALEDQSLDDVLRDCPL